MNPHTTTQVDDITLVALPTAVNCAELFVRFALTEWSLRDMLDDSTKVARDLVSAIVAVTDRKRPCLIQVRARLHSECLVIEVVSPRTAPIAVAAGRRVEVVALRGQGQLAWCELPLPGGMAASSVPLPRRHHRRAAEPTEDAMTELGHTSDVDEDVMRRILYGLNRPDSPRS
ncbi:MAG TPA: ATP-binding protein [Pseudonocardiaceae bacterium]